MDNFTLYIICVGIVLIGLGCSCLCGKCRAPARQRIDLLHLQLQLIGLHPRRHVTDRLALGVVQAEEEARDPTVPAAVVQHHPGAGLRQPGLQVDVSPDVSHHQSPVSPVASTPITTLPRSTDRTPDPGPPAAAYHALVLSSYISLCFFLTDSRGASMMSDDDRDIDIESDAEKRAHHNALERKRRDHIKDSFTSLKDAVPTLQGEKVASRAQILKKAADYIVSMRRRNGSHQQDIDDLRKQNAYLENEIHNLERSLGLSKSESPAICEYTPSESSDSETGETIRQPKKLKMASLH
ncbi:myc proto-oncogene protein isoform X2 [Temnothorax curvispinosus]|uniref:Protein max n=2 Tax=Temnothorax TaxID=300110 RepID=A0A6J1REV7_9HYME|nr:myc proto-oncogene protein isoform X2 [Temnothorax curvispinosus]